MLAHHRFSRHLANGLLVLAIGIPIAALTADEPAPAEKKQAVADEPVAGAWPPAPPRQMVTGIWLLANGGNERYLVLWLKDDGTFVRAVVHHPDGGPERIRFEGEAEHDKPWKFLRVPRGGYKLVTGEAKPQPDGSTISNAQSLQLVYIDGDTLNLGGGGFRDALVDLGSNYRRASDDAAALIADRLGK